MKTVKYIFIFTAFTLTLFTSCKKSYNCECREQGDDSVEATYSISESSKSKAQNKCDDYNQTEDNTSKGLTCTIK